MTRARSTASKANTVSITQKGGLFIVQEHDDRGHATPTGEFHETSYDRAHDLAVSRAACSGMAVIDMVEQAKAPSPAPAQPPAKPVSRDDKEPIAAPKPSASEKKREAALKKSGWTQMADKALAAHEDSFRRTRKEMSELFGEYQRLGGERGETVVTYTQKTHWAFLDMFAHQRTIIGAQFSIMQQMTDRIAALEEQVSKQPAALSYRGVHRDGEQYGPGNTVTSNGSLWHCNKATRGRPGEGSPDWTLCVKRGRDGRDARP